CDSCAATLARATGAPAPPAFVDEWFALYAYDGLARELVARIKYRNARAVVPFFADAIVDRMMMKTKWNLDCITWAPTTIARRRERGFDHAELLARATAQRLNVPARRLLTRNTRQPQTGRAYADRHDGVRFRAAASPETVMLIDDVTTTGATLRAAARALRDAGTKRVLAAIVARTPAPGHRSTDPAYTPPR